MSTTSLTKKAKAAEKEVKEFKKKNIPFKTFHKYLTEKYRKTQEAVIKRLYQNRYETANEKKLFETYQKIAIESFSKENTAKKFRLSHVYQLGVDFQILFLYSKKDIGKTRQLGKALTDIKAKDPTAEVAFIRNTEAELEGFKKTMNDSIHGPTGTNGEYVYWKDEVAKNGGCRNLKPCGFMAYTSGLGFKKGQGSEFENLKFWIGDECNSTEGGVTEEIFKSLYTFLSSIIRDKKNVKGFMMGNLLEKNNIFLSRLGVGSKTRLKILNFHEDDDKKKPISSTMLYLNTGDLFEGIEKQVGLAGQFLTKSEHLDMLLNRPGSLDIKAQYEELDLKNYQKILAFVYRKITKKDEGLSKKSDYILYLYKIQNTFRFVCGIDVFDVDLIKPGFPHITCYQKEIANCYPMTIIQEKEDFADTIEAIGEIMDNGELWFGGNGSQDRLEDMWPTWEGKFLSTEDTSI